MIRKLILIVSFFTFFTPSPVFAQADPCLAYVIPNHTCSQPSYDTCIPGCSGTSAVYNCHASQDPINCIGTLFCAAEDSRCSSGGGGGGGGGSQTINIPIPKAGYTDIGKFIGNILTVLFTVAILIVLFMLVWGAYEWITSGGDKEAVGQARARILGALIGLAVLAVSFALANIVANFLGFEGGLTKIIIPPPQ